VFRLSRSRPPAQKIDLATVRETLAYIEDDVKRVPGLEKVAAAITTAMREIDTAGQARSSPRLSLGELRFLTRRS